MIRVTFQRIQPNTMQVCGYRKLIFIVGHNESIVAHASSESSCETGGKLKGSPRNSMLFLRHAARLSIPFLLSVFVRPIKDSVYLPFPTFHLPISITRDYNLYFIVSRQSFSFRICPSMPLDMRISRFQITQATFLSTFRISQKIKNLSTQQEYFATKSMEATFQ